MAIIGRESITVVSKTWTGEDDYGNPIESTTSRIIKNVLVGQTGSTIIYGLSVTNTEIDIVLYLSSREVIKSSDEFIYQDRHYLQSGTPTLWRPSAGSINKPKLIVNLKMKD